jgi:hypothetical protein
VFHAPGKKEGLNLEGMEGKVIAYANEHQGIPTSANLPYKVEFQLTGGEKPAKFVTHMVSGKS